MDGKFTIRDIIVYFITGFLFFIIFIIVYPEILQRGLKDCKDYTNLIGFAALPFLYILGHFVHAIDVSIFSRIGKFVKNKYDRKPNIMTSSLHHLFNGHRIRGILDKYWDVDKEFIDVVSHCSDNIQYNEAKYWSHLNDTFKGYTIIFLTFSISSFSRGQIALGLVLLGLTILFRERGRFFGIYYVQAISRIYHNKKNMLKEKS